MDFPVYKQFIQEFNFNIYKFLYVKFFKGIVTRRRVCKKNKQKINNKNLKKCYEIERNNYF